MWPVGRFRAWIRLLCGAEAAQLLEFAISLPLLVVFVVGIFDFGDAFNLKQKLNTAAREGARRGSNLPTGDLDNSATPTTVLAVRNVVDQYLIGNRVDDCGLNGISGAAGSTPLSWVFTTATSTCPGPLTLTVERGYSFPALLGSGSQATHLISTRVSISYPYQWHFNRVITLLVPSATYAGITQITTNAVVPNMD